MYYFTYPIVYNQQRHLEQKKDFTKMFGSKNRTSKIASVLAFLLNCVECSSICQYNYSIKTKEME